MADNTGDGVTVGSGSGVTAGASGAGSTGEKTASDVIRELRERAQKAETALAEVAAKEEAARQEKLRASGQFEELEKGLKSELEAKNAEIARLAKIASEHEAREEAERKRIIESLPEAQREYASKLAPDLLPGFVAAIGGTKPAPPRPGEPGVNMANKLTPQQISDGVATGGRKWLLENAHLIE